MRPTHIIIHHSLTKDSKTVSWSAIRDWHTGKNPESPHKWSDIGYHYGIELVGGEYEIFVGRMMNKPGAHCMHDAMNYKSLGICCIGDFDKEVPNEMQWKKCVDLARALKAAYRITVNNILGHGEVAKDRTCPGSRFNMDLFRMYVED